MSLVNLMGDVVPTEDAIVEWSEAHVSRAGVTPKNERILARRMFAAMLPPGHPWHRPLTLAQQAEMAAAVEAFDNSELLAAEARQMAALLRRVLAAEQGVAPLAEDDTIAQELLSTRALARPAPAPEPAPEPEAE